MAPSRVNITFTDPIPTYISLNYNQGVPGFVWVALFKCDLPFKGQWLLYVPSVSTLKILFSYITSFRQPDAPRLQCAVKTETAATASVSTTANFQVKLLQNTGTLLTTHRDVTRGGGASGAAAKVVKKWNFKVK
jgi:hypothetical protein